MRRVSAKLESRFRPVVDGLGYAYVGATFGMGDGGQTLRVYIDHADGITIDDCALVSQQISAVLDVEDLIVAESYNLEVSSPGMDRPLFDADDYLPYIGQTAKIRMAVPLDGRRNFRGVVTAVAEDGVSVEVDGEIYELRVTNIERANLVPEY